MSYSLGIDIDTRSASIALQHGDLVAETLTVPIETDDGQQDGLELVDAGSPFVGQLASVLRWMLDAVISREGAPPVAISITYPAHWRPVQLDLVMQAVRRSGLRVDRYLDRE